MGYQLPVDFYIFCKGSGSMKGSLKAEILEERKSSIFCKTKKTEASNVKRTVLQVL
jgi:hypothetical protein